MDTLLLDSNWDLTINAQNDWATIGDATPGDLTGPGMRLAQDVASRCQSWRGEVYYDTTQGIRYENILGFAPNVPMLNNAYSTEALNVPGCRTAIANLTFTGGASRNVSGVITVADVSGNSGTVQIT